MDDLFGPPRTKPGTGNARFLADLAEGVSDAQMRKKFKNGEYPDLGIQYIDGWRQLVGRSKSNGKA